MKLFTRCRILANVLTVAAVVLAVVLGFQAFELGENLRLVSDDTNRWLLFFVAGCVLLFVLVLVVVVLRCVIKDAQEDVSAAWELAENPRKTPQNNKRGV